MGQKNPVKVTRRNNKQQKSQQTRNRQTWSFPWVVEKALSGELGGSAPHWISDLAWEWPCLDVQFLHSENEGLGSTTPLSLPWPRAQSSELQQACLPLAPTSSAHSFHIQGASTHATSAGLNVFTVETTPWHLHLWRERQENLKNEMALYLLPS